MGALSSDWASAYAAVPRSAVLPDVIRPFDMETGRSVPVSRAEDPDRWQEFADADVPIATQWDDGTHTGREPGEVPTSSTSMPSVVFRMLQDLDLHRGHTALETGTATLWNSLLMAHRAGPGHVTTMEVDRDLAEAARATAERFGNSVRVHGDGFQASVCRSAPKGSGPAMTRAPRRPASQGQPVMSETRGNVNRPLLFLDVDGPLNPYAAASAGPEALLEPGLVAVHKTPVVCAEAA
ncbi:hypothetical protein [Streptomyces hygroscopicus]|uniref:hypothetical protein n=1 Tax=Streptomyces hygroscopicus TaxID=1912 RepID=UPI003D766E49